MARSIRINLKGYERLSENKRVIKKIKSSYSIKVEEFDKDDFNLNHMLLSVQRPNRTLNEMIKTFNGNPGLSKTDSYANFKS